MNGLDVIDIGRGALWMLLKASLPLLLTALLVGIVVALFQALTHIQELALVFIPKFLSVIFVFFFLFGFYGDLFQKFSEGLFSRIVWIGSAET